MKVWNVPGIASAGYAAAPVFVVKNAQLQADERNIRPQEVSEEIRHYESAVKQVQDELMVLAAENEIFEAHCVLAGDVMLHEKVTAHISEENQNAEAALCHACEKFVQMFEQMDSAYMRERAADMKDVTHRILCVLKGVRENPFASLRERSIIVAEDLAPSDTAKMNLDLVAGIITEKGGVTSHVAIIAKNHGIPYLVGAEALCETVHDGMSAVLDANAGVFYLEPEEALKKEYEKKEADLVLKRRKLAQMSSLPSETADGYQFRLCGNVGSLKDVEQILNDPIDGVGLFRSEFLFMEQDHFPTEEEQLKVYAEAAQMLHGKELTIRTLDIGGDKGLSYHPFPKEDNPFLGYRAIRMCLKEQSLFKTQLRAILRAGVSGNVRVMFPMMISVEELCEAKKLLKECMEELSKEGKPFCRTIPIGMMIETPAAVWMAEEFAELVDFFSIGTNDLTQYILAVDRGNAAVSEKYDPFHPAVLRAVRHTIEAAHRHQVTVGMCGEFAGNEEAAGLLLGMGLDEFSMSSSGIAAMKYALRQVSYQDMQELAKKALLQKTAEQVKQVCKEFCSDK